MNEGLLTALATILLVIVGLAQMVVLIAQKKQSRIALTAQYRELWANCKKHWGVVIFIGRDKSEYYQVLDECTINELVKKTELYNNSTPTRWALDSIQKLCGILGEVSTRVLQGHLKISDIYPIFGTEFLRHSRPLRRLFEPEYKYTFFNEENDSAHNLIRNNIQDWLIYHDGLRRRCLILIDLLWAEAARLEDLPPDDMKSAADAKKLTGNINRDRVFREVMRLNGITSIILAFKLSIFLRRSEYFKFTNPKGIKKKRQLELDEMWTKRLLRNT